MAGSSDWPIETVPLSRLRLDRHNVRIRVEVADEEAALEYLYAEEDVMDLVRKIARYSYFDNEQPIAFLDGDEYVVLEGNRRVSALKGLADPDRIPAFQKRIEAEIERALDGDFPSSIRVMVAPDREAALPVVARLHTRDSKKAWALEQQAAFYYDRYREGASLSQLRALYPAEAAKIPRFILMGQMIAHARAAALTDPVAGPFIDSRAFKMTTFEYLYNSPVFRKLVGMSVDAEGKVEFSGASGEFLRRLFVQVVLDMKDKRINTRNIRVASNEHSDYIAALGQIASGARASHEDEAPDEVSVSSGDESDPFISEEAEVPGGTNDAGTEPPPSAVDENGPEAQPSELGSEGGDSDQNRGDAGSPEGEPDAAGAESTTSVAEASNVEEERQRGKMRLDQHLDFSGMPLRLVGPGMRLRYEELQTINVRRLPNATFDFLRSFIECAIKEYFAAAGDPVLNPDNRGNGPVQLKHCLAHLDNRLSSNPIVKAGLVRLRSNQHHGDDYFATAAALNDSNHEPNAIVRPEQVNLMWAQVKPLVMLLLAGPPQGDDVSEGT